MAMKHYSLPNFKKLDILGFMAQALLLSFVPHRAFIKIRDIRAYF